MDLHPSGLPRLVGPEGSPLPDTDFSHALRYLPNNVMDELPPPQSDSLLLPRLHSHHVKVRVVPTIPRTAPVSHSLCLRTEYPKRESPRELPSSPTRVLLTSARGGGPSLPTIDHQAPPALEIPPSNTATPSGKNVDLQENIGMKGEPDKDSQQN